MNNEQIKKHIVFILVGIGFPNGTGATARILSYAAAYKELGFEVSVLCLRPSEVPGSKPINLTPRGLYRGINYTYTCNQIRISKSKVKRIWSALKGLYKGIFELRSIIKKNDMHILYYYKPISLTYVILLFFLSRKYKIKFIGEITESPHAELAYNPKLRTLIKIREKVIYKFFDEFVVISKYLEDYLKDRLRRNKRPIVVPIIVDYDTFSRNSSDIPYNSIVYCGNLAYREELKNLLKSFAIVSKKHIDWNLIVIGDPYAYGSYEMITELISEYQINDKVILTGPLNRTEVPKMLAKGKIMVLPRANGVFSQAGFPTKLGEYLAVGRPIVVTTTGEIPVYLKHGENAYLVPPDNIDYFANQVNYVIEHYQEAICVGLNGQRLAKEMFDSKTNCEKLLTIIKDK